ncbi:hypothetical protein HYQ46_008276 [Verticillium longisporum]|nr:hypothetical protein HYQ46_008276 [Verticillium longisporum]
MLFLLSTHYTHYDLAYFIINFMALLAVVIPKLPFSHRMRGGLTLYIVHPGRLPLRRRWSAIVYRSSGAVAAAKKGPLFSLQRAASAIRAS